MNKKGFTLVELLAVIALLAILILLALPNILKLFNQAKKNIFLTEARTVYKEATKKYINESVKGNTISKISSTGTNKLNLAGEQLDYCLTLDSKGKVTSMKVANGDYYIEYSGNKIEDLNVDDIKEGTIDTSTCRAIIEIPPNPCTFDGNLVQGAEYTNGQYTYRYKQDMIYSGWTTLYKDGWGVALTDPTSTDPVTTKLCTSIKGKPIISMSNMFYQSQATSIDASSFDTSNVTDMGWMFKESAATQIIGIENWDTSKVTNMDIMFEKSHVTKLNLSNFDTSNVTSMYGMFNTSELTELDISNFDTSKVTSFLWFFYRSKLPIIDVRNLDTSNANCLRYMFHESVATQIIGLENFNTSKVTDIVGMFRDSNVTNIDVSNFDTSSVTEMTQMFYGVKANEILGLENFNTNNVTNMSYMFSNTQLQHLNVTHFNTSNVTNMAGMFRDIITTTLDLSSFDTRKVTDMHEMFVNVKATTIDLSSFDTSNVTNMSWMFMQSKATTIYVSDKWNTSNVTNSSFMFYGATNLVGAEGTTYSYSNPDDKTYAHVDGGVSNPGYFTYKAN